MCTFHIETHIRQPGDHGLILLSEALESLKIKASHEAIKLGTRITEAYDHGKGMIQEILDRVNSISQEIFHRQKELY